MYNKDIQSKANKKWRELNPEKWSEINRQQQKKYYETHKEQKQNKVYQRYYFKKEAMRLMAILI
jgi:hypothetical protein